MQSYPGVGLQKRAAWQGSLALSWCWVRGWWCLVVSGLFNLRTVGGVVQALPLQVNRCDVSALKYIDVSAGQM